MRLVERAKNLCLAPRNEWTVIAGESPGTGALIARYVLPLAAVSAVAGLVGGSIVGRSLPFLGTYRVPFSSGLALGVYQLVMAVVGVLVLAFIINALAPTFGGQRDGNQALKVAAYSYTPAWIAGILTVLPGLGVLALLGALYGLYLLYLGLPRLMKNPEARSLGYTAVVVVCAVVLAVVVAVVGARITAPALMGSGGLTALEGRRSRPEVQFDKDSPMGKLQDFGKQMEQVGKKMEAAQKSGNQQEQVAAAMEGLGTMLGGGKRYDPLSVEQLKSFVPESLGGLPRTRSSAEKNGVGAFMVSKAEATYGEAGGKHVELAITDTGGAGGLMTLASWANVRGEREDDSGIERTRKEANRFVHERIAKGDGRNEFELVLGDRFVVTTRGQRVAIDELRAAASSLDLARLESMKDAGAQVDAK